MKQMTIKNQKKKNDIKTRVKGVIFDVALF